MVMAKLNPCTSYWQKKRATRDVQHGRARDPIGTQRETSISVTGIGGIQGTTYLPGAYVEEQS